MAQPVHVGKSGAYGVALIDAHLVNVVAITRYQRVEKGQSACPVEYVALLLSPDRNHPAPATPGPAGLEYDMVALVGKARLEFHRLFPAKAEGLLQFQAHADVSARTVVLRCSSLTPSCVGNCPVQHL